MKPLALAAIVGLCCVSVLAQAPSTASSLRIARSYTSTVKSESHTKAEAPDTNGAVGPAHVVEFLNGDWKVYDKKTGKLLLAQTSQQFWDAALGDTYGPNRDNKDPRMVFDAGAQRWYASAQRPADADASLVVARSNTADPTQGWKGVAFYIDEKRTAGTNADFDRIGYNADGIYVTINQMTIENKRPRFTGVAMFAIKKSDFNKATPVVTMDRREHVDDTRDMVPVIDHDGKSHSAVFWGGSTARSTTNDVFARGDLAGDVAGWKLERTVTEVGEKPGQQLPRTANPPVSIPQPAGATIFSLFRQPSAVHLVNGEFWMTHGVGLPDDKTRTALRWWRIRASDNAVVGEGILSNPNVSLIQPSMAVDRRGNIVIASVGTSTSQPLSIYAMAGRLSGDKVTFDAAFTLVKAGLAPVTATGGRWGDYTTTVVDPTVPGTFWVFAPYAQADGTWATEITELRVQK